MTRAGDDAEQSMRRSGAMTRAGDDAEQSMRRSGAMTRAGDDAAESMRRSGAINTAVKPNGPSREEFAERLLKGSVKKSYAPVVDIDWYAPLDPDKFYLPPIAVSLYGTPLRDEMTSAQRT